MFIEKVKKEWKTAKAKFKRLNQKTYTQCMVGCVLSSDKNESGVAFDSIVFRDNKFKILLEELIDGDGNIVNLDREFYDNVTEELVIALVDAFDRRIAQSRLQFILDSKILKEEVKEKEEKEKKEKAEVKEKEDIEKI